MLKRIIFENFSLKFLFTLRVFARNLLRGNRRRNTFCILFWCLVWGLNSGFTDFIYNFKMWNFCIGTLKRMLTFQCIRHGPGDIVLVCYTRALSLILSAKK